MNKVYLVFSAYLFLLMISCNNDEASTTEIVKDTIGNNGNTPNSTKSLAGCYSMIYLKDTATLSINIIDSNVSGKLQYKWFEKDDNDGAIKGVVRDNLIIANYTFQSEGVSSVREVVFSIKNDSLFEGYGEVVVQNDTTRFVNTNQITFMKNPLIKVDCTEK